VNVLDLSVKCRLW